MATQSRHYERHPETHKRVTIVRRTQRRAQRTTEGSSVVRRRGNSPISPASSGWSDDTASGCILHPSTSRCWWREGELSPSEYGNAGAHPQTGSISCGAVARGPRFHDDSIHKTTILQHDAPHQDWHVGPVGFPPTMGRGDASPR